MRKKAILIALLGLNSLIGVALGADAVSAIPYQSNLPQTIAQDQYRDKLSLWQTETYPDNSLFESIVVSSDFVGGEIGIEDLGYTHPYRIWDDQDEITVSLNVPSTNLYSFMLDFFPLDDDYLNYELEVIINGSYPYHEARQIILYKHWNAGDSFTLDRYGNDFYVSQTLIDTWYSQAFLDPMGFYVEPLVFKLNEGDNLITLKRKQGSFALGDFTILGNKELNDYQSYVGNHSLVSNDSLLTIEAETPDAKNSSSIQAGVARDLGVTPFDVSALKLNILAGTTFASERDEVVYHVDVPTSGYYQIAFKIRQSEKTNAAVFRTLKINGATPFSEAVALRIPYAPRWQNYVPANENGDPYLFYLEAGSNEIALSVNLAVIRDTYYVVRTALQAVNQLALDIRKLTGNQVDEDRDWDIIDYLPTIDTDLLSLADLLDNERIALSDINQSKKASEIESHLALCVRQLRRLAAKPNDIPKNITMLATSPTSIAALLGIIQGNLVFSPLDMDKLFVYGDVALPEATAGFFPNLWLSVKRFFLSFFDKRYSEKAGPDELIIWVNRSKQYVDLIQKLADDQFTKQTGIQVKVSVMNNESKLILANSAKQNPDVALGIASWMPYDMGVRGALYDLTGFMDDPGFKDTLMLFNPEALVPLAYDNGLYGLPDTENFYVLFYRTDILSTIDVSIPDTWDEVTEILPILKRYGMNFYIPLSSAVSLKSFDSTLPFLFQYGSTVYAEDAFHTAIDDPQSIAALTMMTELYTIYSMDVTVSSFYNDFRLGKTPIGVGDFGMYVTLLNAAPDIQGLWGISLLPGVQKEDHIDRSAPGAATANIIFDNTEKPDESWAFLKWWASTTTQVEFSRLLLSTLGKAYMWNSANVEAFRASGFQQSELEIILEQWEWLRELPKVPGFYQVELEISNLWNKVVLDRKNLRIELYDAVIRADREIRKKMSEFDYMDKYGNALKPYVLTDREIVLSWIGGDQD